MKKQSKTTSKNLPLIIKLKEFNNLPLKEKVKIYDELNEKPIKKIPTPQKRKSLFRRPNLSIIKPKPEPDFEKILADTNFEEISDEILKPVSIGTCTSIPVSVDTFVQTSGECIVIKCPPCPTLKEGNDDSKKLVEENHQMSTINLTYEEPPEEGIKIIHQNRKLARKTHTKRTSSVNLLKLPGINTDRYKVKNLEEKFKKNEDEGRSTENSERQEVFTPVVNDVMTMALKESACDLLDNYVLNLNQIQRCNKLCQTTSIRRNRSQKITAI